MVVFAEKYPEKLSIAATLLKGAFEACGASDAASVMAANGSWHFVLDSKGKEAVKTADFEFLVAESKGKTPVQYSITFEEGKLGRPEKKDLTEELGEMSEESAILGKIEKKLLAEQKAVEIAAGKLTEARKASPHLRITMVSFSISDDDFEVPAWRVEANNWPLISYLKGREKQKQATVIVSALDGKVLAVK